MRLSGTSFRLRGVPVGMLIVSLAVLLRAQPTTRGDLPPTMDPQEIVRRSLEIDNQTADLARNYTYQHRDVRKHLGLHGEVKAVAVKTWDVTNLYGEPYSRLIQKDDKPLSAKEQKEEEEKQEKFLNKRKKESEGDRQKRQAKEKKERDEERAFIHDAVNAYDFRMVGEEAVSGRDAWVIEATPRQGFHPTQPHAGLLSKIKGKVWIDKQDYTWMKVEGEVVDTASFGLFVARIRKGSRFSVEQVRLNDEIWLMRRYHVAASARLLLLSNRAVDVEGTFYNYKRFTADTRILPGVREVEPY